MTNTDPRAYLESLPTLESIEEHAHAVTFTGRAPGGQPMRLEVPRPLWVQTGRFPDFDEVLHVVIFEGTKGQAPHGQHAFKLAKERREALTAQLETLLSGQQ